MRSRILDCAADSFICMRAAAEVIELGNSLETWKFRLVLIIDADWYDVDYPEVIAPRDAVTL